jgi:hypothetical protein
VNALHGRIAETAFRNVDNALELQVVRRIGDDLEIGNRILDFLPFVEARAADDTVRQPECNEAVFDGAHLRGRTHENGDVVQLLAGALEVLQVVADGAGFGLIIPEICDGDPFAGCAVREQSLAEAAGVLGDKT